MRLLKDWTLEMPDPDSNAPTNGFLFINAPSASALIFKTIRNKVSPIYVTSVGAPPPPGQHTLVPGGRIMLFFADADARTAFNENATSTSRHEYSYIDHPHITVYFDSQGHWQTINDTSSDAVATDAFSVMAQHRSRTSDETDENSGKPKL